MAKVPVRHDPGKIILDLAVAVALGGDCLADFALLWAHPEVFARSPPIQRSPG
ncbi:putative transposase [Rhodococcus wratislaviensis IFP 2016]|nr:putative transposase [Rhodococcus wratislaviensis IFP 2016]